MRSREPALDHVIAAGWLLFAAYLVVVVLIHVGGHQSARRGETPLFTDYTSLYAASLLVKSEPAANLYRPKDMYRAELDAAQAAYGHRLTEQQARVVGFSPWMYPPIFILYSLPLAYLSYLASYVAWLAATAVPYLAALRAIVRDRLSWVFALAAPPAFFNIMYGQTGFLTAGLIGLGLSQLARRPALAGLCIGLASFKPHFGVLIPLALMVGGHWKPFWAATLTVVGLIAASLLAFGPDPWYGLIGTAAFHTEGFAAGAYNFQSMATVLSLFRLAGADIGTAWAAQYVAAALAVAAVVWAWRARPGADGELGLQSAVLCTATVLALPMAYLYDLVLLVPAAAWLWEDMRRRPHGRWELAVLAIGVFGILGLKELARLTSVQAGPVLVAALLLLALRRLHLARRTGAA